MVSGLAASLPVAAPDDGLVIWAKDYPKAGPKAGQIVIQGSAKAQTGYALVSATADVWPRDGGELKTEKIALNKDGTFGATTISGLDPGRRYNVVVSVIESCAGQQDQVRKSDPAVVTAGADRPPD
jgi:hypothetical protein